MERMGVDAVRISPQWQHTAEVVQAFRRVIAGEQAADAALSELTPCAPGTLVDGYWRGLAGMVPLGETVHASA